MIATAFFAFAISTGLVIALIPAMAKIAKQIGLVDSPDKKRKLHSDATPLVGGITIAIASIASFLITSYFFDLKINEATASELIGLLIGSLIILFVGVADDRFDLRGRQKLVGQIIAASVLIFFGYQFKQVAFASVVIKFGICLLYTSPSPRDRTRSRMPSSA